MAGRGARLVRSRRDGKMARRIEEPTLFAMIDDTRAAGEGSAADRYREPSLLDAIREAPAKVVAPALPGMGKPDPYTFESGFCDDCRRHGFEARAYHTWRRAA